MHGVAGALWVVAQWPTATRRRVHSVAACFVAAIVLAGLAARAIAAVEYDYTGSNFTTSQCADLIHPGASCTPLFTTSEQVTGDVVFNSPLTPDTANSFPVGLGIPLPFAFTLSDGVDTILSTDAGVSMAGSAATFITNAQDQIVQADFGVLEHQGFAPNLSSKGIDVLPSGSTAGNTNSSVSDFAQTFVAGTWSGPTVLPPVLPPMLSPDCVAAIAGAVLPSTATSRLSANGFPYEIRATFSPTVGMAQAASACNVTGFDWQQTITNFPPTGTFQRPGQLTPTTPLYDPQPGGWTIPAYCKQAITPPTVPSSIGRWTLFDPSIAQPFPFYYQPNGPSGDCLSLSGQVSGGVLHFYDSPSDTKLDGGEYYGFTTCLVGYRVDPISGQTSMPIDYSSVPHDCFSWTDDYTGFNWIQSTCSSTTSPASFSCDVAGLGQGGIPGIVQLATAIPSGYPGLGSGGIEIGAGVAPAAMPEPRGVCLFIFGVVALIFVAPATCSRRRERQACGSGTFRVSANRDRSIIRARLSYPRVRRKSVDVHHFMRALGITTTDALR
jgi:hypothetical protein